MFFYGFGSRFLFRQNSWDLPCAEPHEQLQVLRLRIAMFILRLLRQWSVGWAGSVNSFLQCRGILQLAASSWIARARQDCRLEKQQGAVSVCVLKTRVPGGSWWAHHDAAAARGVLCADDFIIVSLCCLGHGLISVPGGCPLSTSLQAGVETISSMEFHSKS